MAHHNECSCCLIVCVFLFLLVSPFPSCIAGPIAFLFSHTCTYVCAHFLHLVSAVISPCILTLLYLSVFLSVYVCYTPFSLFLQGAADPLFSSFHIGYNMLLNLMRVEGADPEYMIRRSFLQFQANLSAPKLDISKHHHWHDMTQYI